MYKNMYCDIHIPLTLGLWRCNAHEHVLWYTYAIDFGAQICNSNVASHRAVVVTTTTTMPQAPRYKTITKVKSKALPPHYKSPPTPAPTRLTIPKAQFEQWVQSQLWVTVKAPPPLKALCPQHTPIKHVTFQDQQPPPPPPPTPPPRPIPKPAPKPKPRAPKPPPPLYVPPKHPPPQHHHLSPAIEAIQITLSNFNSQPAMTPPPPPLPTVPPPSAPLAHPSNPAVRQTAQHHLRSPPELHHSNPVSPYFGHWWLSPRLLHHSFPCSMPSPLIPRLQWQQLRPSQHSITTTPGGIHSVQ